MRRCYCNTPDVDGGCLRCDADRCSYCRRDDPLCFACRYCAGCGEAYTGPDRPELPLGHKAYWFCWICRVDQAEQRVSRLYDRLVAMAQ